MEHSDSFFYLCSHKDLGRLQAKREQFTSPGPPKHTGPLKSLNRPYQVYELASKIYAWSVFVSLLSVPYRFPWFWILQVCIHRGIVFCQSPIVFQGKSRKQHRDETSLTKVVDDNFEVASYIYIYDDIYIYIYFYTVIIKIIYIYILFKHPVWWKANRRQNTIHYQEMQYNSSFFGPS